MVMDCFIAWTQPGHSLLILSVLTEAIKRYSWGCDGAGSNISPVCGGQLGSAPGPADQCLVSPPSSSLPPPSTLSTIRQISHVFTPGNWIQYNNDKWLALLARHNISISHDTLPLSPDCQIFCSKLVNSLQQGQSIARADGSHLINCRLSPHPRESSDRATANSGIYNHQSQLQQSVSLSWSGIKRPENLSQRSVTR